MTEADEQQLPELLEIYTQVTTRFQDSGGYELDYRIDSALSGLHIDYLPRTHAVAMLSGGEKARVGLAALLLRSPGLLLLDEPTNHLDFASMDWLESYLSSYRGTALIVSHDKFASNFFAQRVDSAIARNVRAAEEQLRHIEADPIPKPPELLNVNSSIQTEPIASQVVLRLEHVSKRWGEHVIFDDLSLESGPTTRILLTGPNGAGKTTLLKMILGQETPDSGRIQIASGAKIGYLPQDPELKDLHKTVIETYRYGQQGYEGEFIGRLLGYGLFRLEDMDKQVGQLSVGQRRKLEIACLMAAHPNVLLLDEPTNYISLDVPEAFEASILAFPGPVIAISHDRWFINRFKGELWELKEGQLKQIGTIQA